MSGQARWCSDHRDEDDDRGVEPPKVLSCAETDAAERMTNKTDIEFLGGRRVVEDVLRAYHPRMGRDGRFCTEEMDKATHHLRGCLHALVLQAGDAVSAVLNDKRHPPARKANTQQPFYITNMRFESWEMPWEQEHQPECHEEYQEEKNGTEDYEEDEEVRQYLVQLYLGKDEC